jgi:predicted DNA-binding protein
MVLNNAIFKRDDFINARLPKEVKKQFELLALRKGRSKSEYILELILKELEREEIKIQAEANHTKN